MPRPSLKHVISFYDLQGLCFGIILACVAMLLLKGAGLVTGQTSGLALLLSYAWGVDFGLLFFAISFPFFLLGWLQRGVVFAMRTLFAVTCISVFTPIVSRLIVFEYIDPLLASVLAGACAGFAVIAMFRHNASAGGMSVLSLVIEQRLGIKTGWTQLTVDFMIFAGAATVISTEQLIYSFIGAAIMNLMVAWNFRIEQSTPTPEAQTS
ncbi:MAG: YitT family protein [Cognatishimia sp.]